MRFHFPDNFRLMKTFFALMLVTATALFAEPATLNLGSRGELTIYFPDGWKVGTTDMAGQMTVSATPEGDANAACHLTITFPERDRFDSKARLKLAVETECYNFAQGSVEGKAIAREFTLASGYGFYCNFTDPELRGKPPQKGNYKVVSMGKIRLAPNVLVDVGLNADGFRDKPYQELLGAIEGMEFKPGK